MNRWKRTTMLVTAALAAMAVAAGPGPSEAGNDLVELQAEALSRKEVKKSLVSEVHRDYLVLKVTLVPSDGTVLDVVRDDFRLRIGEQPALRPEPPELVAFVGEEKRSQGRDVTVVPVGEVGYSSGPDPRPGHYGQRRSGVYYRVGAGVGVGGRGSSHPEDREVSEIELTERGLPEGETDQAVTGFLYFAAPGKKGQPLRLEYAPEGAGELAVTLKRR